MDQSIAFFTIDDLVKKIKEDHIDIVGLYSCMALKKEVKHCIVELKKMVDLPIVVGGPGFLDSREYLESGCDVVCDGEGEKTIIDIMDHFNGKKSRGEIKGITYLENGDLVKNEPRELIQNMDDLPFPKRDRASIKDYHDYYIFTMKKPYVTMMASRGCPMKCTFCTSHLIWRGRYRVRSVDNVLEEMDILVKDYGVRYIAFLDDIFGLDEAWASDFCAALIKRKYKKLRWMCILHPFSLRRSRNKLLDLFKKSGCDTLSFGIQSAHPQILKNIKRHPEEPEELERTIRAAKHKGFLTSVGIIFGLPGETRDTIKHTIDYCCRLRPTYAEFYNLELLEGSEIEKVYRSKENVCDIPSDELIYWCRYAAKKFYINPYQILYITKTIVTKNPLWFLTALKNSKHFLNTIGY